MMNNSKEYLRAKGRLYADLDCLFKRLIHEEECTGQGEIFLRPTDQFYCFNIRGECGECHVVSSARDAVHLGNGFQTRVTMREIFDYGLNKGVKIKK